ncbi:MAG: CbtA family protein [Alphaproteobacteria bacterium]
MFRPLVLSAAIAGLVGGLLVALYQFAFVTPLIVQAEVYEAAVAATSAHASTSIDATTSTHGHAPASLSRQAMTAMATIVHVAGANLVLLGLMVLAGRRLEPRTAITWGLAAFVAVAIAPAIGLPPELPGMMAADVGSRQVWWIGTVLATSAGLWGLFRGSPAWIAAGLVLIVLPHIIGAPHLSVNEAADHVSDVPAALAARFVAVSIAGSLIFWTAGPAVAGFAFGRLQAAGTGDG